MRRLNLPASMLLWYPASGFLTWSIALITIGLGGLFSMQDMLDDATSPRPHVPWALVLLIVWCAVEAAIFTFTLRPTISEVLAELTGVTINAIALVVVLWFFLTIIIAGSFACIHVLNEAIAARQIGNIVQMALVQIAVAMFQVLFLYRELGRPNHAVAGARRHHAQRGEHARPRLLRMGRRARHDVVPVRPHWCARVDRDAQPPSRQVNRRRRLQPPRAPVNQPRLTRSCS